MRREGNGSRSRSSGCDRRPISTFGLTAGLPTATSSSKFLQLSSSLLLPIAFARSFREAMQSYESTFKSSCLVLLLVSLFVLLLGLRSSVPVPQIKSWDG